MDWLESLQALKDSGTLPAGKDPEQEKENEKSKNNKFKLKVTIDRKGRNGKTATIIEGFDCEGKEIEETAAILKKKMGVGGSCRGNEILIQGERKTEVEKYLKELGYSVK